MNSKNCHNCTWCVKLIDWGLCELNDWRVDYEKVLKNANDLLEKKLKDIDTFEKESKKVNIMVK